MMPHCPYLNMSIDILYVRSVFGITIVIYIYIYIYICIYICRVFHGK